MSLRGSDGPADRAASERLLDAARAGHPLPPGAGRLALVLAAAAAPAGPAELPGEQQALAAFRAATANPPAVSARLPRWRGLRLGVAAWGAGLTAVATAGVAVAAVNLHRPVASVPPPTSNTSGSTSAGSTGAGSPSSPAQSWEASPSAVSPPSGAPDPTESGAPGPAGSDGSGRSAPAGKLAGHCRAYLAKSDRQRAKALEVPGFADLVIAAGGADQVEEYCIRLVPEAAGQASPGVGPGQAPRAALETTPAHRAGKSAAG